jgi:hypothetical protein
MRVGGLHGGNTLVPLKSGDVDSEGFYRHDRNFAKKTRKAFMRDTSTKQYLAMYLRTPELWFDHPSSHLHEIKLPTALTHCELKIESNARLHSRKMALSSYLIPLTIAAPRATLCHGRAH